MQSLCGLVSACFGLISAEYRFSFALISAQFRPPRTIFELFVNLVSIYFQFSFCTGHFRNKCIKSIFDVLFHDAILISQQWQVKVVLQQRATNQDSRSEDVPDPKKIEYLRMRRIYVMLVEAESFIRLRWECWPSFPWGIWLCIAWHYCRSLDIAGSMEFFWRKCDCCAPSLDTRIAQTVCCWVCAQHSYGCRRINSDKGGNGNSLLSQIWNPNWYEQTNRTGRIVFCYRLLHFCSKIGTNRIRFLQIVWENWWCFEWLLDFCWWHRFSDSRAHVVLEGVVKAVGLSQVQWPWTPLWGWVSSLYAGINGPYQCGSWPDLKLFRNSLLHHLETRTKEWK